MTSTSGAIYVSRIPHIQLLTFFKPIFSSICAVPSTNFAEKKHNRFLRIFLADLPENEHQASPLYTPTKCWISAKSFTNICSFLLVTLHNHYSKSFCQPSTIPALLSLSLPSCVYSVNKNVLLLLLMVYKTFSVDSIFREIFDFWFLIFLYLKKHLSKGHLLV